MSRMRNAMDAKSGKSSRDLIALAEMAPNRELAEQLHTEAKARKVKEEKDKITQDSQFVSLFPCAFSCLTCPLTASRFARPCPTRPALYRLALNREAHLARAAIHRPKASA